MQDNKQKTDQKPVNHSICPHCGVVVPSDHRVKDGKVYLVKHCPDCGESEFMVSTNSARYYEKRDFCGYKGDAERTCSLDCINCNHGIIPSLVFIDVTNRCNMNCPICLANIPAMGFRFDPPMEYFEKIFKKLATMNPIPKIQIFGGEPTVREDLIEFITLAKSYGISARVVTNGIRLADEEYCKSLLKTGCQLMFGFDGRSPDIYRKIRKNPTALDKKMAAFQNIRKHRKSKVTIMCAVGYGINDNYMADLIDFCFESRDFVAALDLIPLAANWGPETVDAESSTPEDVEKIMADAIPGVEFFPAGILYRFNTLKETFNLRLTFGGAHPNYESVSLMISDGTKYQPLSKYLKHSQSEAIKEAVALDAAMGRKVETSLFAKIFGKTGRKILVGLAFLKLLRKHGDFDQVFNGGKFMKTFRILMGVLFGQKLKTMLRKYTRCQNILRLMVLPFEEKECVESARLVDCPASFAYEHPVTGQIHLMPVCAWTIYKNDILRKTAQKYGTAKNSVKADGDDLNVQPVESV